MIQGMLGKDRGPLSPGPMEVSEDDARALGLAASPESVEVSVSRQGGIASIGRAPKNKKLGEG